MEFKGVANSVFMAALYQLGNFVYFWDQGYIKFDLLNITQEEQNNLKLLIDYRINQYHMEYCSADEIYEFDNGSLSTYER
jgi:hypothetical protein